MGKEREGPLPISREGFLLATEHGSELSGQTPACSTSRTAKWPRGQAVHTPPPSTSRVGWSGQAAARPLEMGGQLWEPSLEWPPRGGTGPLGAVLSAFHCLPVLPACQQLGDGGAGVLRRRGVGGEQNCVTRPSWCFHPLWGTSISGGK